MKFLFNSDGQHIANEVNGQLHAPSGQNIGHFLPQQEVFIDMRGRYLGEIVQGDRLLRKCHSPYQSTNFGNYGNYGNVGNYGNPGNHGSIGIPGGYENVDPDQFR
jgi:hypothetical protein